MSPCLELILMGFLCEESGLEDRAMDQKMGELTMRRSCGIISDVGPIF